MLRSLLFALARFLVGGQARWHGSQPSTRQRIYFANHGSHLDTILISAALPEDVRRHCHPVAAADYWGRNVVSRYFSITILNSILIDRKGATDPLAPLRATLAAGESLIIFPEGTRTNDRLPHKLKSGIYHLAREYPHVELIPVYLENLNRALPKGALLPVPIYCIVKFGSPLFLQEGETKDAFLERARQAIIQLAEADI